jgi:hypothetical protein
MKKSEVTKNKVLKVVIDVEPWPVKACEHQRITRPRVTGNEYLRIIGWIASKANTAIAEGSARENTKCLSVVVFSSSPPIGGKFDTDLDGRYDWSLTNSISLSQS